MQNRRGTRLKGWKSEEKLIENVQLDNEYLHEYDINLIFFLVPIIWHNECQGLCYKGRVIINTKNDMLNSRMQLHSRWVLLFNIIISAISEFLFSGEII